MRSRFLIPLVALALLAPLTARAIPITSQIVHVDMPSQTVYFTLALASVPDFFTFDEYSRNHDDFQYWIRWDVPADLVDTERSPDVIVTSTEIRTLGGVAVRLARGPQGGPGGWGPLQGVIPYSMIGSTITFSLPLAMLSDVDGRFSYTIATYVYGGTSDVIRTVSDEDPPVAVKPFTWGRIKALYR